MIQAVIFDMFETLITHYKSSLYFGSEIAKDAKISEENFMPLWRATEHDRSIGKITTESVLEIILRENNCYAERLLNGIMEKRIKSKEECFRNLHPEIINMLTSLKVKGVKIGLISNCFSEEVEVIRKSELFSFFDEAFLSYEEGIEKPDEEIFIRCAKALHVKPTECIYVGDGGSYELEAARKLGMKAVQAAWYLQEGTTQQAKRKREFIQIEKPLDIVKIYSL